MLIKKKNLPEIILLIVIPALVFLPNLGRLTYFKDDWYFIYDGYVAGAGIFRHMFEIDRPARGVFFELYYSLFGPNASAYHIGALIWRVLAGIAALWLFDTLWPARRKFVFLTSLLFVIYPGYMWWVSIEYQPHVVSLCLQVFSIALSLKAFQSSSRASKILCLSGAIITGWLYISLVDYAIGMEAFRFLCIYVLVSRDLPSADVWRRILATFKAGIWNVLIPLGFVFWRSFLFNNERKATDIGLQLGGFFNAPIPMLTNWFLLFLKSILNLEILAWVSQFPRYFFGMRLRDIAIGLLIGASVIVLLFLAEKLFRRGQDEEVEAADGSPREALLIGIVSMVLGILPVVLVNRYMDLGEFSHYTLPVSLAAALSLSGFVYLLSSVRARSILLSSLVVFAALTHFGISVSALSEEAAIQKFWWQASWRIPALRPGTTLVINYPSADLNENGNGVMEAPNVIYFPEPQAGPLVHYRVSAVTLSDENWQEILVGKTVLEWSYRSHEAHVDYGNILVLSQPTPASCVHVMDGDRPLLSQDDPGNVMIVSPSSRIENVLAAADPLVPPQFAFGMEPEHHWCYYYEKAELAAQREDWDTVVSLGEEALSMGLHPEDRSEWMPFLYGYALTGSDVRVKQIATKIVDDKFLRSQACDLLTSIKWPLTPRVQGLVSSLYCKSK